MQIVREPRGRRTPHYAWASQGWQFHESPRLGGSPFPCRTPLGIRRAGGAFGVREAGPRTREEREAPGGGRVHMGAGGRAAGAGGGGAGVWPPRLPGGICMCVVAPDFLLLLRCRYELAGRGGRAAGAPRRGHLLTRTPGPAAQPPGSRGRQPAPAAPSVGLRGGGAPLAAPRTPQSSALSLATRP